MNIIKKVCIGVGVCGFGLGGWSLEAVDYRDFDRIDTVLDLNESTAAFGYINGSFNIRSGDGDGGLDAWGFDPVTENLLGGSVDFGVSDEDGFFDPEVVSVELERRYIGSIVSLGGGAGFKAFDGSLSGRMLGELQDDGVLQYKLELLDIPGRENDVRVNYADLRATARHVPESGGTAWLLAIGLVVMLGAGRLVSRWLGEKDVRG